MPLRTLRSLAARNLALAALAVLAGCAENNNNTSLFFEPFSTKQAVSSNTTMHIQERYLVYMASELETGAGGHDYNNDGDVNDQIPFVINMVASTSAGLQTAARDVAIVGTQLYLVVAEADDQTDWNNDGDGATSSWDDLVLLHCSVTAPSRANLTYVATLQSGFSGALTTPRMLATDNRLFFTDDPATLTAPETTLEYVSSASPTTPTRVLVAGGGVDTMQPSLMAIDEGMLFLTLDENIEGRDLNGDADMTDGFVLALLDTTATTPTLASVALSMANASQPVRALKRAANDWVVAFLVDEASQGGVSRNNATNFPASWRPTHCTGPLDTDATDRVMAYLTYASWAAASSTPVNTGFAGVDRVLALKNGSSYYVATIVPEGDEGNCTVNSLNNDGDFTDRVLRWIKVETPLGNSGIFGSAAGLVALADTAGGTHGVTDLAGRFIAVVDEAADDRDHDGQTAVDHHVIGWLDPTDGNSAFWEFDHGTQTGLQPAGTDWMAEREQRDRVLIAFQEAVYGFPINNSDADTNDSVPTFARFDPFDANDFDFPGPAIAVQSDNAGIVIQNGFAFYRVDENADNRNWNGDGDKNDKVLFRTELANIANTNFVSTLSDLQRPAVVVGPGNIGAAFITDESAVGLDLNGDGDTNDFVVRWMRIGP